MTVMDFFGCAFLAFGPPLAMFTFTVAAEPIRIIILIASAFFWLISLLLSSVLWYAVVPLQNHLAFGLVFSVLFQEAFRYLLYWVLRKAERGLDKVTTTHVADSRHVFAYVCGLGFGFMSGVFALVNVLADAVGPGTMGLRQGTEYFFIISAATTLCFILLHTFWGVVFFSALDRKNWGQVIWVVGSHLFVSCMTLLNVYQAYVATTLSAYVVLIITTALAFKVAGGRPQSIVQCFSRQ
ncbi:gamma-secretase subunit Aph-1 [Bombus vosnesenskii]|uniref:Gamma-secretase subunit Aph-1 n=4 Tax=Bombus TaxID=28641 RepID=A0A6J3K2Z0_9HYME|nr:gamma-secretase subunit Aph-1 [Bombus terrestris]XP_003492268.1 gamma-secretase subunit Aph-1 [Bombus impatiens]XP_033200556.1 gamma-secretase subunit Aph-1 [Bombus vancouverensis nearcticus]XP_033303435.1 gamma-secretase subunit Aph-1 [Bombus bifarius]XP_033346866.1 gamma-secretase subunit Aph-1 [Bombus vosnesenskii]XP_043579710.1 gamma-secretase subunit Aph-1 [Bombus pyrosoma]XP_050477717.1 gamma-secretase subunit Aph-1 [Bombus huntii]XP_050574726.1 gamma-secretase subunit Aph-1 [Bombus